MTSIRAVDKFLEKLVKPCGLPLIYTMRFVNLTQPLKLVNFDAFSNGAKCLGSRYSILSTLFFAFT